MSVKSVAIDLLPSALTRAIVKFKQRQKPAIPQFKKPEPMEWLSYINPGMLVGSNLDLFAYCLDRIPSGAVIEIGSWCGLSLNHILLLLKMKGRENPVFSVDDWWFENATFGQCIPGTSAPFDDFRAMAIQTFRSRVMLFNKDRLPHHIELNSDRFFAAWGTSETLTDFFGRQVNLGGPIAFAYIDGAHTYEQSMRDFQNVSRHLIGGGFIVFDDSADDSDWGSRLTAQEAAKHPGYELIAKNPNYCVRKKR
jgi:hypothetical protein